MRESKEAMNLAAMIVRDLELYVRDRGLTHTELIQAAVITERMILRSYPGSEGRKRRLVQEALATYEAMTSVELQAN